MPCYEQQCRECGCTFEAIVLSFSAPRPCPECESTDTEQLVSVPNFRIAKRRFEIKRGPSHNPYENLVLQHVRDEQGKPIRVNSEAELHAAEKRHGFIHNASWGMEKEPPKHEKDAGNIARNYKWKWAKDPEARKRVASQGVSTGTAKSANDTLAYHPRPI